MAFKMNRSPNDEKLFYNYKNRGDENVFTLGRGSYADNFDITPEYGGSLNILGGRFSSLAVGILFLTGGNHSVNSVTTSPLDVGGVVKNIFGKVRPDLRPIPNVRIQHRQIILGHDVWIGRGATIMGGVKIGNGAIIGANAVVAKNIPPYAIAVGNPARVIKYRFDEATIKKFLAVKWWNWDLEKIADNFPLLNDVENFLKLHYSPALEDFPEDEFTRQLNALGGGEAYNFIAAFDAKNALGSKVIEDFLKIGRQLNNFGNERRLYQFIPDFNVTNPLWSKVVKDFKQANSENALLVIWLEKAATEENLRSLTESVGDNKNIFIFKHDKTFSPAALRKATHFITTREMSTLVALDYLWDTDVKIISALDDGIFDEESPFEWKIYNS